ncbi:MAG: SDR family NAD(P)-dependent oxidoreductase [Chloroflexota bacterium]
MGTLKGKVILVTGAGKGSGRAMAETLASQGAIVAANDITPVNLDETVQRITAAGGTVRAYVEDVAKKLPIQTLVNLVLDELGRLDGLVCCAEVEPVSALLEMDDWDWQRTLDVNLTGTFLLVQTAGRVMRAQGGGMIAVLGARPRGEQSRGAYQTSKAALAEFTRQAARELSADAIKIAYIDAQQTADPVTAVLSFLGGQDEQSD